LPYRSQSNEGNHDAGEQRRQCDAALAQERSDYSQDRPEEQEIERVEPVHEHRYTRAGQQEEPETIYHGSGTGKVFCPKDANALYDSYGKETDAHQYPERCTDRNPIIARFCSSTRSAL
jgi:hypothetical protein